LAALPGLEGAKIAVIGLGYVGLPLAVEFGKQRPVVGFDIDAGRIAELQAGIDRTKEVPADHLAAAAQLRFTDRPERLGGCDVYIVTVPTPVDAHKRPDLRALTAASETVGRLLKPGNLVVYESTVYPGMTEEVCVPVLEAASGLTLNEDFFVGYSPERINPGDAVNRLPAICKITSGSTPAAADFVDGLYREIITAGTHKVSNIAVAEAAKVIENSQRDINIALINELAIIFNRIGIDTEEVLAAAGTKWNFLNFRPGLVGGHCIPVDPYYLTFKAEALGYRPEIILAGRRLNDSMGAYVAQQLVKAMLKRRIGVDGAKVLVLGVAFKENCPDLRNSRVIPLIEELGSYSVAAEVWDPWVDAEAARRDYGLTMVEQPAPRAYDGIVLAVAHSRFKEMGSEALRRFGKADHVLYDVKSLLPKGEADLRL